MHNAHVGGVDIPFPYPYGSDLCKLWGWGKRIETRLDQEGPIPTPYLSLCFRPCEQDDDVLLRFSMDYPELVAELRRHLEKTESAWMLACQEPSDQTEAILLDMMDSLSRRIYKAAELIYERQRGIPVEDGATTKIAKRNPGRDVRKVIKLIRRDRSNNDICEATGKTIDAIKRIRSELKKGEFDLSWLES